MGDHVEIGVDDPRREDVRLLLERHLAFAYEHTPPADVHALAVDALLRPDVTFFSARIDGRLVGVGALKELDATHAELKSMHTAASSRRQGVGRAIVRHVVDEARRRGYRRLSLETGRGPAFEPAQSLYASTGFAPCPLFGEYTNEATSCCMTMELTAPTSSDG